MQTPFPAHIKNLLEGSAKDARDASILEHQQTACKPFLAPNKDSLGGMAVGGTTEDARRLSFLSISMQIHKPMYNPKD